MIGLVSATILATGLLSGCTAPTPPGAQTSVSAAGDVTATVVAIDKVNRQITLRGQDGRQATLDVPPEVQNFTQIMAGDTVRLSYRARIDFLVTGSTVPVTGVEVTVGAARAAAGQMPAGLLGAQTRLTVQIVSVDRSTHTVTFRLPDGSVDTITAMNPANFAFVDGLQTGTNVLVTVTRALAVSVDRA
jgi:hypothetical protein